MWTAETRRTYDRKGLRYPTDMTDAEWAGAVTPFGLQTEQPGRTGEERRWRWEARSAWLRLAVLLILVANLWAGEEHANLFVHLNVQAIALDGRNGMIDGSLHPAPAQPRTGIPVGEK